MTDMACDFRYFDAGEPPTYNVLWPAIERALTSLPLPERASVFDLGCGSGFVANEFSQRGYRVAGCDPSTDGIAIAKRAYPHVDFVNASCYDDLHSRFGAFDLVVSLEVVEHVYAPRQFARTLASLIGGHGYGIVSTPYHGYLKNLALAVTGQMDRHFTALWDNGHIKFWSRRTLTTLLAEAGLEVMRFERVGRIPALAKSMILIVRHAGDHAGASSRVLS